MWDFATREPRDRGARWFETRGYRARGRPGQEALTAVPSAPITGRSSRSLPQVTADAISTL